MKPSPGSRFPAVLSILFLFLAAVLFSVPLVYGPIPTAEGSDHWNFHNLMFDSHERLHYVIRLSELHDALNHGQWVVRWARNLEGGYGYPFFNFYAPLSYYLAELWHLAGMDLFNAWKMHFCVMAWLSAVGAYLYARLFFCHLASVTGALFYLFAPYHILNLYVRGNVAEFTAMTVFPFLLYFIHRLVRNGGRSPLDLIGTALGAAALILTHNLTAFFGGICIIAWCGIAIVIARHRFPVRALLLTGTAGVLMAAFFWMPVLLEMKFTHFHVMDHTFEAAELHTVSWWQFFVTNWGFGNTMPGPEDEMSFSIGWPQWVGVFGSIGFIVRRRFRNEGTGVAAIMGASLFLLLVLMSNVTSSVWHLPVLSTIQFPWRLLAIASLCAAIMGAYFIDSLQTFQPRVSRFAAAILLSFLACVSWTNIGVRGYWPNEASMYRPENTRRTFTNTNIGEFRPKWVQEFPASNGERQLSQRRIMEESGQTVYHVPASRVTDFQFRFTGVGGEDLFYEAFYFPGWKASVDGEPLIVEPVTQSGLVGIKAMPGTHNYRVYLGSSPARIAGNALSWTGVLLLALLCTRFRDRISIHSKPSKEVGNAI